MRKRADDGRVTRCVPWSCALLLTVALGCSGSATSGTNGNAAITPVSEEGAAPKGNALADPALREARAEAEALLRGLLSGKFDQDENLAVVAEKVKGYTSWSVTSQTVAGKGSAQFKGTLSGPAGKAHFSMLLVKQAAGKWAVGTFSGPN